MGMDTKDTNEIGERSAGDAAGSESKKDVEASEPASYTAQLFYDQRRDRYRTLRCILIPLLVGSLIYFGAYRAVQVAVQRFLGADSTILATLTRFAGIGLLLILGALIVAQLVSRMDRRPLVHYEWTDLPRWIRDFSIGVVIGAIAGAIGVGYLTVRGYLSLTVAPTSVGGDSVGLSVAIVLAFCFFMLSNNIFEEVLFRGIVLEQTVRGLRPHANRISTIITGALIISAVIFGLFHFPRHGVGGVVSSTIIGILFGTAYLLTGRLAVAIGVHFGWAPIDIVFQEPIGNSLMSVVAAEVSSTSPLLGVEAWLVRVIAGVALLVGLSYAMHGEVRIHERFYA